MDPALHSLLNQGPLVALLVLILYGGFKDKPWWVFGKTYEDMRQERDLFRDMAIRSQGLAEKSTDAAAAAADAARQKAASNLVDALQKAKDQGLIE